jgi:uncharacterized protein with beta-barrel porin domain
LVRAGLTAVALLIFAAAFIGEAAAQQTCRRFCNPNTGNNGAPTDLEAAGPDQANAALSGQAALLDVGSRFAQRLGALSSFRTAASAANNPQGGGAEPDAERYRTWFEGYGLRSTTDAQGTFTGDHRKTYGGVAGVGATIAPGLNVGLSVDHSQTRVGVTGAAQNGRIDLTQVGALASFERGPWNLSATLVHGLGDVRTSRFEGSLSTAAYQARLWAVMTELSYYVALPNNSRFVPKLAFDWLRSRTDAFAETGGVAPIAGSAVTASRVRLLIGGELGHSWLVDRRIMDFSVYGRLVDNLSQDFGAMTVTFADGPSLPLFVSGVRESQLGADAGATLSAKVTDAMRIYAVYDGRFRSNLTSHSGTIGAEFRF